MGILEDRFQAQLLARVRRARKSLSHFIEMAVKDDHATPIQLAEIHMSWIRHLNYAWSRNLRCMILAPFGHGKCQAASSKIQLADGSIATFGALSGLTVSVLSFDEKDGKYRPAWGSVFPNGTRKVRRLTLHSGREIDVTDEHPFKTIEGWKHASVLQRGSFVATANALPSMGSRPLVGAEAALLGYLVGDGGLTSVSPTFTNADDGVIADFQIAAECMGFNCPEQKYTGRSSNARAFRLSKGSKVEHGPKSETAQWWLRLHGLWGCGSWEKETPPAIFTAPLHQVAEYLGAYFACDGTVDANERGAVEYYSVSRHLLEQVQSLLARFGVVSRLRRKAGKYKGEVHLSWRLAIARSSIGRFHASIPVAGEKSDRLRVVAERVASRGIGNGDIIPLAYRQFIRRAPHWHKQHTGVALDQGKNGKYRQRGTARELVRKVAEVEGNETLLAATAPEIWWDEVVDIVELGEMPTFGIDVDRYHTYVSEGVIVHNSSSLLVPLCAYLIGQDPNLRIKIITNDDDSASKRVGAVKRLLESPVYHEIFPDVQSGGAWTGHELYVKRIGHAVDPTVQARGIFTTGIGGRADVELLDDVVDQKNSMDPIQRRRVLSLLEETWFSRLEPDGHMLGIGTPWHQDDANHHLMQRPRWCTLKQAVADDCTEIQQTVIGGFEDYPDQC
jgi:intein/homing endonuclease